MDLENVGFLEGLNLILEDVHFDAGIRTWDGGDFNGLGMRVASKHKEAVPIIVEANTLGRNDELTRQKVVFADHLDDFLFVS